MDSGNSGSIQSSSGGDEEYDSRAESISAFLINPTGHVGPMSNPPQPSPSPPPFFHRHLHDPMFDTLSNYFDPLSKSSPPPLANPTSLLNLDTVWSKTLRSDPNCTEINPIMASPSSVQSFFTSTSPTVPFPPVAENTKNPRTSSSSATTDQTHVVRSPKKRSRASRRAPTTVLTTDTTNFRAMVQEFTGIPAQPFTSSSLAQSRFDLIGTPSTMRSNPNLLRPFAQKFQPPPFVSSSSSSAYFSSSMVDGVASSSANNITCGTSTTTSSVSNSTSISNYQLPFEFGLLKQRQNLLNMQNQILKFQSLLQSAPKYPLAKSAILGSKAQGSNDSHLKMDVLDEFGLSHGHVHHAQLTLLPNLVSSDGTSNNNYPMSWADGGVGTSTTTTTTTSNGDHQSHFRSVNGNYDYPPQSVTSGKLNYSTSSSNFQGPKMFQPEPEVKVWWKHGCVLQISNLQSEKKTENNGGSY